MVSPVADMVRLVLAVFEAYGVPQAAWGQVALWEQHLPRNDLLDASTAAACCRSALTQSRADWRAEQCLFHKHQTLHVGEDWAASAWDDPWSLTADPRSAALDKAVAVPFGDSDFAVYGDGGYDEKKTHAAHRLGRLARLRHTGRSPPTSARGSQPCCHLVLGMRGPLFIRPRQCQ